MPRAPRKFAHVVLALYVSGLLALLFHLASEDHFPLVRGSALARPSLRAVCPCQQSHVPHAAGDHEANQTSDAPQDGSLDLDPATGPVAFALPAPLARDEASALAPSLLRIPVVWISIPPDLAIPHHNDSPRAPPAA